MLGDEVEFGHLVDADIAIVDALSVAPDWLIPTSSIGQTPAFVAGANELVVELCRDLIERLYEDGVDTVYTGGLTTVGDTHWSVETTTRPTTSGCSSSLLGDWHVLLRNRVSR